MDSTLVLTFSTDSGKDLSIRLPDADKSVNVSDVSSSMLSITLANAIEGVNIKTPKFAVLYTVERKEFEIL